MRNANKFFQTRLFLLQMSVNHPKIHCSPISTAIIICSCSSSQPSAARYSTFDWRYILHISTNISNTHHNNIKTNQEVIWEFQLAYNSQITSWYCVFQNITITYGRICDLLPITDQLVLSHWLLKTIVDLFDWSTTFHLTSNIYRLLKEDFISLFSELYFNF